MTGQVARSYEVPLRSCSVLKMPQPAIDTMLKHRSLRHFQGAITPHRCFVQSQDLASRLLRLESPHIKNNFRSNMYIPFMEN